MSPVIGPFVNVAAPSSAIADTIAVTAGTTPASTALNNYVVGDTKRVIQGTMAGPPIDVWAIPWTNATNGVQSIVGVLVDGTYFATLTYAGAQGLKQKQTLTVDGAPHQITFVMDAAITDVVGEFTYTTAAAPSVRVVVDGDSKSYGINSTVLTEFAWPAVMRTGGALPAGWRVTDWGTSGKTMFGNASQGPLVAARCDGLTKNIVVIALDINDFIQGVTLANFTGATSGILTSIKANAPAGTKILLVNSPQTFATPVLGGGVSQTDIETVMGNAAAADPTNVTFFDCLTTLFPGSSPWAADYAPDGVHFTNAGHALMAAAVAAKVQTL